MTPEERHALAEQLDIAADGGVHHADFRAAAMALREDVEMARIDWTCTWCNLTWLTDELEQAQPDGRYACPVCTDRETHLIAVPVGAMNALRKSIADAVLANPEEEMP